MYMQAKEMSLSMDMDELLTYTYSLMEIKLSFLMAIRLKDKIIELKKNLNIDTSTNNIRLMINKAFGKKPVCSIKYLFSNKKSY